MDIRLTPLSDRVQYFLDCAQEASEMDGCTAMTLNLYGDNDAVAAIIEAPRQHKPDSHYKNRRAICLELAALADTILPQLSEQRCGGLVALGLRYLTYEIKGLAEIMACWTIEDDIEGGCMEPFRRRLNSRDGIPFKRTMRRLRSPRYIRRYVKLNAPEHAQHLISLHRIMMARVAISTPRKDPDLNRDWEAQREAYRRAAPARLQRAFEALLPKKTKKAIRHERKVIRRSLDIANGLLGQDMVRSFLRGETVKMMGAETILMVRKIGALASRGHGCLSVAIADRNGATLADLCTYIEKTPTLDQLVGFALWMNAGEERAILKTANIIRMEEGADSHPLIVARRAEQQVEATERLRQELDPETFERIQNIIANRPPTRRRATQQLDHDQRRERNQRYWEETMGSWLEAMMVFVIGYRNFPLYKSAGAL